MTGECVCCRRTYDRMCLAVLSMVMSVPDVFSHAVLDRLNVVLGPKRHKAGLLMY